MKQKNILLVIGLFISMMTFAQPPGPPGGQMDPAEMAKKQTKEMVEDLGLDEEQATKVEAVNTKFAEKMQEMFKSGGGPGGSDEEREAMHKKMDTLHSDKDADLKEILTEEQYKKYQEIEKKKMEERRQHMGDGDDSSDRRGRSRESDD